MDAQQQGTHGRKSNKMVKGIDMKTIVERAFDSLFQWDSGILYHQSELTEDSYRDGYIIGATDQLGIDTERACKWLTEKGVLTDSDIKEFKKAMEEEQ